MSGLKSEKIVLVDPESIESDPRASALKKQILKILSREATAEKASIENLKNVPITIIYGPKNHWVSGIVLVGYTGVEVKPQRLPEDDGCLLTIKTGNDGEERVEKTLIQIMDEVVPTKSLNEVGYSDLESLGILTMQVRGASSGSLGYIRPSFRCNLPSEGGFSVSQSILVHFSQAICDKFAYPNKLGQSPFYVTAVTPVKK